MRPRDYLWIGLKLVGVMFVVYAVNSGISAASTLAALFLTSISEPYSNTWRPSFALAGLVEAAAYVGCCFVLLRRTDWCLRLIDPPRERQDDN